MMPRRKKVRMFSDSEKKTEIRSGEVRAAAYRRVFDESCTVKILIN